MAKLYFLEIFSVLSIMTNPLSPQEAVRHAAELAVGFEELGKHLNRTKGAVHQWTLPGRQVPAEHCPDIERISNGLVLCEQLRPDVSWWVVRRKRRKSSTGSVVAAVPLKRKRNNQ
ncbi:transcriptional regulator [Laribacter hongkongensis]|uniref:transcriptional regulator n=2 Tax=Laribacter hongkongensis TaxID=168471 RepID=UPI001EFD83DC|nr:YdaS family helix-turn-helix protein [Laribacter hongkongensis]MCG8994225.1 helix-turn-helix domain-containing protein [Laribacter hongkongensis]MCG9046758.1 helix-turn-helix domain-containing protein [Laribacter hongkongensis]